MGAGQHAAAGVGMAVGAALWGGYDWHHGDVDIDVNRYNNFNKTNITSGKWEHSAEHRKGVQYRDAASQQKYNRTARTGGDAREAFRSRAESGRQELERGGIQRNLEGSRRGAVQSGQHVAALVSSLARRDVGQLFPMASASLLWARKR